MDEISKKTYTKKQLDVIGIESGYNMVLAGPGCGKTDILAERIAKAYEQGSADLSDMLCLTFTNRAARGMYDRIRSRLGDDSCDLFVGNIHRYCSHFLFENGVVSAESSILDEDDTAEVLNSEISDDEIKELIDYSEERTAIGTLVSLNWYVINDVLGIDKHPTGSTGKIMVETAKKIMFDVKIKVMEMQHLMFQIKEAHPQSDYYHKELIETDGFKYYYPFISDFKEACKGIVYDRSLLPSQNPVDALMSLADKYSTYKEDNGLLDFDDLLIKTYDAYYKDNERTFKRYKWVQIDEIQDLSNFQIALVDLITDKVDNFVVLYLGDEQQAIYSFMGASLDTLNMLKTRCKNHIYHLDKNFRSPKYLLDIYNEYAVKLLNVDKDFLPEPKDNKVASFHDVCIHDYESTAEEVDRVYGAILPFLRNKEHENERTALLVPWNIDANEISDRLVKDKIPHFKISGLDSFQTVHMKTLIAHFNAVDNDFNIIAWSRILKQTYAVDSFSEGRHIVETMRNIAMCPSDLMRGNGSYLSEFVNIFDNEEIVLFDTETTGTDVFNDDIIQIAAIKIRNGQKVQGSEFNIFLQTDKKIPERLGKKVNPMVEAYKKANKFSRDLGLSQFISYVGNSVLMGHNVDYDYNILRFNLRRYCDVSYHNFEAYTIDTLKLAHLICPHMRMYKLEYLIDRLGLAGQNSHMADDDILATFELAKYCRKMSYQHLAKQQSFFQTPKVKQIIDELNFGYKECYEGTRKRLYELYNNSKECVLIAEMLKSSDLLSSICEFRLVNRFDLIVTFIKEVVDSTDEPNALKAQFANHLMDISTYREADLCASLTFSEKLFVSTVHKAKGLEFENVIVMRAVNGRYPHFAHKTIDKQDEDKRLFYVAISRAKERLVVSGSSDIGFTPYLKPIMHRFTLRFRLFDTYLIEIGYDEMRILREGKIVRNYKNISILYGSEDMQNQFDLKREIVSNCRQADFLEGVDEILRRNGVQI